MSLQRIRRLAGYGAAATLSLYLLVKVIWVVAGLFTGGPKDTDMDTAEWVVLNTVTVGMAGVGVVLGLALAHDRGRRIPSPALIFFSWVGAGFLIPLIPFMAGTAVLGAAGVRSGGGDAGHSGGGAALPAWERVFISIGFAGMAIGLAVALPIYMRERWPRAFQGRLGDLPRRAPRHPLATRAALVVSSAAGLLWLYWALGGTLGLDTGHRDVLDANGRMLTASWGLTALVGAWSIHALTTRRWGARLPLWLPMVLAFAASGSLFAWSGWKLPLALLRPGDYAPPEFPVVAVVQHTLCLTAGAVMLTALPQRAGGGGRPRGFST